MKNGLIEQEDLNFLLYDWLNIEDFLIKNNSEIDRETIDAFFDLSNKIRVFFFNHYACLFFPKNFWIKSI